MTPQTAIEIGQEALKLTALLVAPMLLSALAIGLLIGMLQAATQIQEMTLSFIPKLAVLGLALTLAAPWMLGLLMDFTERLFESVPYLVG